MLVLALCLVEIVIEIGMEQTAISVYTLFLFSFHFVATDFSW